MVELATCHGQTVGMNRTELVARIWASNPHLYRRDIEGAVDTILGRIADTLAAGGRVELRDFGTFALKHLAARSGCNPRTGLAVEVAAKAGIRFKPGKGMQARLNPKSEQLALAAE